jgi:hypothetical protein
MIATGRVDGALSPTAYTPSFLLGSALVAQGNPTTPQAETSTLTIQGADVRVVDPVDNSQWMNNDVLTAGTIEPASGATPSYLAISASIMDSGAIAHFLPAAPTVLPGVERPAPAKLAEVYVKFHGTTLGGAYVESDEFLFPVYVCNGCLVTFPAGSIPTQPNTTSAYCSGTVASTSTAEACTPGQDQSIDCQQCFALDAVCDPKFL